MIKIKFGIILILLGFMKKISSLGKKVKVNIPSRKPKGFEKEDLEAEAEAENENESKLKPKQFLELKKNEKRSLEDLIQEASAAVNDTVREVNLFNNDFGIVSNSGGAFAGKSQSFMSLEKNRETNELESEKEYKENKEGTDTTKLLRQMPIIGFENLPQMEFLKENYNSPKESEAGISETIISEANKEKSDSKNAASNKNLNLKGKSSAENSLHLSHSQSISGLTAAFAAAAIVAVNPLTAVYNNKTLTKPAEKPSNKAPKVNSASAASSFPSSASKAKEFLASSPVVTPEAPLAVNDSSLNTAEIKLPITPDSVSTKFFPGVTQESSLVLASNCYLSNNPNLNSAVTAISNNSDYNSPSLEPNTTSNTVTRALTPMSPVSARKADTPAFAVDNSKSQAYILAAGNQKNMKFLFGFVEPFESFA